MNTVISSPALESTDMVSDTPLSLLRMLAGTEVLAVPIESVREILQVVKLTPLPRTPDFIRGVMNMRGAVMPVIDLAVRIGRAPTEIGRRSCIVVVEARLSADEQDAENSPDSMVVGLLVDAVYEVFDCHQHDIEIAPSLGTRISRDYITGMTRAHNAVISILDLGHLLSPHDLAADIASFQPH
jgi:purine-binding chemotaxis protein CheW